MVVRHRQTMRPKRSKWPYVAAGSAIILLLALLGLGVAFPRLTYKGVPLDILLTFIQDPIARQAYFDGDKTGLHDRLNQLDIEEQIKAFYRPQFQDEAALDLHIHQLLYDNTGYIGTAYRLGEQGQLVPISNLPQDFAQWFDLARQLNLFTSHNFQDGVLYVTTPEGTSAPYLTMAQLYSTSDMQKWIAAKKGT